MQETDHEHIPIPHQVHYNIVREGSERRQGVYILSLHRTKAHLVATIERRGYMVYWHVQLYQHRHVGYMQCPHGAPHLHTYAALVHSEQRHNHQCVHVECRYGFQ